jgi:hypothetical protein
VAASAVAIACAVALGVRAGQDVSWDLRNYHLWAAFALLHGRHRIDVAPAQLQTWLNPIPYVVPYLLIRAAPPLLANVVLRAFYNGVFGSRFYPPVDFHDARFLPGSLGRALLYPFLWAVGRHPTAEVRFRDARFALIAVLAVAAVATVGVRRLRSRCGGPRQPVLLPAGWVLAVFFVASYATWLRLWAIQRYLATLELLSGVVIAMLVGVLVRRGREGVAILAAVTAGTIAWTIPPSWGRRPFDASWFAVQTTGPAVAPGTLWLIASGGAPVSYVLTELPRDGRAVRLSGNMPLGETSGFWSRTRAVVAEHQGPVRTLTAGPRGPSGPERATVQRLGLEVDDQACDTFRSNFEPFVTCPVRARPARGGRRRAT